jgi:signal transduction histidine kinase
MRILYLILISFSLILLLFAITTFINFKQAEQVNENSEEFAKSSIVVRHSNRFQRNFLNMVSGLRGYLLTNESFFIQSYDSAVTENQSILSELSILVPAASDQKIILDDIRELHKFWIDEFANPLLRAKIAANTSDSSRRAFDLFYRTKLTDKLEKDVQASLQKKFSDFTNYEYGLREVSKANLTDEIQKTKEISFTLTIVSIVAGVLISIVVAKYISSRILRMVDMANSISHGRYEVSMKDNSKGELGLLARALNDMATILNTNITLLKRQKDELDQFAHIVSHDIKAPLRGIDNVVTWIEEDHSFDLPPKVIEYLNVIKGRIKRAENLLGGILAYARIGRQVAVKEWVDVKELVMEAGEYIPQRAGISLILGSRLPVIYTERVPLLQVLTNLIVNAFKYHDKDRGEVRINCKNGGPLYEFSVSDDGPGISPAYHQKIFAIFQTLQEGDKLETTGVGLAIVKKILDDRNLSICVDSDIGKGTSFVFTWPKEIINDAANSKDIAR